LETTTREEVATERPGLIRRARLAVSGALVGGAFLIMGATGASASTAAPDPGTLAGDLAGSTAGGVLTAVQSVLPKLIPWIIAFWAFGLVIKKFMPKNKGVPKL
jgi:hypothetical protein